MNKTPKIITASILGAVLIAAALLIVARHLENGDASPTEPPYTAVSSMLSPTLSASPALSPSPSPTPTPTPTPTPEPAPEYFTLSFMGDCTLAGDRRIAGSPASFEGTVGDDMSYPFYHFAGLLKSDEFSMINLECVITNHTYHADKTFTFRTDPKYLDIFAQAGIEFATLANNHSRDYLAAGYDEMCALLAGAGVGFSGHGEYTIYETENGLRIGVYSMDYITGSQHDPSEAIAALRALGPDLVIFAPHWGVEGSYSLIGTQTDHAHRAIDAGADIVFGTHPHVLQRVEEYNGKYIFYSLGNFVFGGNTSPRDRDSAVARVTVKRDTDGSVSLAGFDLIPCSISSVDSVNNYQPIPYAEGSAEYERAMSKLDGSFTGPDLNIDYSAFHTPTPTAAPTEAPPADETEPPAEEAPAETPAPAETAPPAQTPPLDTGTEPPDGTGGAPPA